MALKAKSESEPKYELGLTIAERDKIDQIMKGMSFDYKTRAVQNIDTSILIGELNRRQIVKYQIVQNIFKLCSDYQFESFDTEKSEEFIGAIKEALHGISRC